MKQLSSDVFKQTEKNIFDSFCFFFASSVSAVGVAQSQR
jgi:hypothetical protein